MQSRVSFLMGRALVAAATVLVDSSGTEALQRSCGPDPGQATRPSRMLPRVRWRLVAARCRSPVRRSAGENDALRDVRRLAHSGRARPLVWAPWVERTSATDGRGDEQLV